ncbi:hypothetical protein N2152v2_003609 [Parachlorella kessleri]
MERMFPGIPICIPNPYCPLAFEDFGGEVEDAEACSASPMYHRSIVVMEVGTYQQWENLEGREVIASPQVARATKMALQAYSYPGAEATARARAALQVSPICPEAYVVLAVHSSSYEEALAFFRLAEGQGLQVVQPGIADEALETDDDLWGRVVLRAWIRGVYGVGNTLRKLGRYREALERYEVLVRHCPRPNTHSSFCNFHAHMPELWYRVHGPEECLKRVRSSSSGSSCLSASVPRVHGDCLHPLASTTCELNSCQVPWLYNLALANYVTGVERGVGLVSGGAFQGSQGSQGMLREALNGAAAVLAVTQNPHVVDYLTGDRKMPRGRIPQSMGPSDSPMQAALYAKDCRDLWEGVPGAIPYILRLRNTMSAAEQLILAGRSPSAPFDAALVEKCFRGGVLPNSAVTGLPNSGSLLGAAAILERPEAPALVRLLLEQGAKVAPTPGSPQPLTPLHLACYYGAEPEVVRLLLEHGGDAFSMSSSRFGPVQPPIAMACNQGNPRELDVILEHCPELANPTGSRPALTAKGAALLEGCLIELLRTSVLPCVKGKAKCQRCTSGDAAHGPHVSFEGCVDAVVRHGLRPSTPLLKKLQRIVKDSQPTWGNKLAKDLLEYFLKTAAAAGPAAGAGSGTAGASGSASSSSSSTAAGAAGAAGPAAEPPPEGDPSGWSVAQLKRFLAGSAVDTSQCIEKSQLVDLCRPLLEARAAAAAAASAAAAAAQPAAGAGAGAASGDANGAGAARATERRCALCRAPHRQDGGRLRVCTGCQRAWYCSKACQRKHWGAHKAACNR